MPKIGVSRPQIPVTSLHPTSTKYGPRTEGADRSDPSGRVRRRPTAL